MCNSYAYANASFVAAKQNTSWRVIYILALI